MLAMIAGSTFAGFATVGAFGLRKASSMYFSHDDNPKPRMNKIAMFLIGNISFESPARSSPKGEGVLRFFDEN